VRALHYRGLVTWAIVPQRSANETSFLSLPTRRPLADSSRAGDVGRARGRIELLPERYRNQAESGATGSSSGLSSPLAHGLGARLLLRNKKHRQASDVPPASGRLCSLSPPEPPCQILASAQQSLPPRAAEPQPAAAARALLGCLAVPVVNEQPLRGADVARERGVRVLGSILRNSAPSYATRTRIRQVRAPGAVINSLLSFFLGRRVLLGACRRCRRESSVSP
jgi:hypothetical protein